MSHDPAGPRYQVELDNIEHGCCYSATVVDTASLTSYGKHPEVLAECPDEETAAQIALALNRCAP